MPIHFSPSRDRPIVAIVGALSARIGRLLLTRGTRIGGILTILHGLVRQSHGTIIVLVGCLLLAAGQANGRDLSAVDFSLRLPAALSKFSPYSDVAGVGGASAGSQYQTSINPAATDWQPAGPYTVGISPQYQAVVFQRGPTVHVAFESLTLKLPEWGSVQPAAVQLRSDGSTAGPFTLLDGDYGQLQWGYKFTDRLAAGLNVNYTSLGTRAGAGGTTFATGQGETVDVRGGLLGAAADHLLVGLVLDYAATPTTTNFSVPACACSIQTTDTTRQVLARVGSSYEYAEKSSIYFDYQYADFWNSTGHFTTHRLFSGIEHQIYSWFYARAGIAYDARGGVSPTAGLGFYPSANTSIDIGFQSDMFRELAPEYGSSKQAGISLAVTF
jgi:hypothetical protein